METTDGSAVINKQGKVVIKSRGPGFSRFGGFSEGRASIPGPGRRNLAKKGFMDRNGKIIVPAKFESTGGFSEGLALVATSFQGEGFIDRNGKMGDPAPI